MMLVDDFMMMSCWLCDDLVMNSWWLHHHLWWILWWCYRWIVWCCCDDLAMIVLWFRWMISWWFSHDLVIYAVMISRWFREFLICLMIWSWFGDDVVLFSFFFPVWTSIPPFATRKSLLHQLPAALAAPKPDELIEVEPIIPPEAIVVVNTTNCEVGPGKMTWLNAWKYAKTMGNMWMVHRVFHMGKLWENYG